MLGDPVDRAAAPARGRVGVLDLARRVGRDLDRVRIVGGPEGDRPVDPAVADPPVVEQAEGLVEDPVVGAVAVAPVRPGGDGRDRAGERDQRGQRDGSEALGTDSASHRLLGS